MAVPTFPNIQSDDAGAIPVRVTNGNLTLTGNVSIYSTPVSGNRSVS